jgi:hypothetical protein
MRCARIQGTYKTLRKVNMTAFYAIFVTRVIVDLGGILSIWCGYRLFSQATEKQGRLKVQFGKDHSLSMSDAAPGIFFAVLGTAILIASVFWPMQYSEKDKRSDREIHAAGDLPPK